MKYIVHNYAGRIGEDKEIIVSSKRLANTLADAYGDYISQAEKTGKPVYVPEIGITILPPEEVQS